MAKRTRTNPVQFYLNDDEQYILDAKFKESKMKSKSAFLRKLILFGFVYDVDYSYLRNYNIIYPSFLLTDSVVKSTMNGRLTNVVVLTKHSLEKTSTLL